jgi:xanthine dehydrogenase accessory factor
VTRTDLLLRAQRLREERKPFVLATVVRAQRPTSAKAGDSALVLADGTLDGFVGGTCAESTVRLEGMRLLETGRSILLRIAPDDSLPAPSEEGLLSVVNPCLSGGTLEIFLEAMMPAPLVHVFGDAPVARALGEVAAAVGYEVAPFVDPAAPIAPDATAVVVASHGRDEIPVLRAALRSAVPYIALVASRRRGSAVLDELGLSTQELERVHVPAGLDIGARTAPEVALSILAEVISLRPRPAAAPPEEAPVSSVAVAVDPVCHMDVAVTPDALQYEHDGTTYYFCGSGCRTAFADAPGRYLS